MTAITYNFPEPILCSKDSSFFKHFKMKRHTAGLTHYAAICPRLLASFLKRIILITHIGPRSYSIIVSQNPCQATESKGFTKVGGFFINKSLNISVLVI